LLIAFVDEGTAWPPAVFLVFHARSTISSESVTIAALRMAIGPIQVIRRATPGQRPTLLAAAMGWALDAFDAMLYSLVLAMLIRDLGMSKTTAGSLGTLTLLASGIGGVLFGFLADRIGRKHALMASLLTYSVCSFASLWTGAEYRDAGRRTLRARARQVICPTGWNLFDGVY
jgi:Major Facilitator Superfamily